jgi:hypothetical protein
MKKRFEGIWQAAIALAPLAIFALALIAQRRW